MSSTGGVIPQDWVPPRDLVVQAYKVFGAGISLTKPTNVEEPRKKKPHAAPAESLESVYGKFKANQDDYQRDFLASKGIIKENGHVTERAIAIVHRAYLVLSSELKRVAKEEAEAETAAGDTPIQKTESTTEAKLQENSKRREEFRKQRIDNEQLGGWLSHGESSSKLNEAIEAILRLQDGMDHVKARYEQSLFPRPATIITLDKIHLDLQHLGISTIVLENALTASTEQSWTRTAATLGVVNKILELSTKMSALQKIFDNITDLEGQMSGTSGDLKRQLKKKLLLKFSNFAKETKSRKAKIATSSQQPVEIGQADPDPVLEAMTKTRKADKVVIIMDLPPTRKRSRTEQPDSAEPAEKRHMTVVATNDSIPSPVGLSRKRGETDEAESEPSIKKTRMSGQEVNELD